MPRKLTFEEVKAEFEARNYELLEGIYINNKARMRFRCPKHPDKETKTSLNDLKNGQGCAYCGGRVKLTYEEAKAEFEARSYELLDTVYINADTPLKYRCPEHPDKETKINLHNLKAGHGCMYCARENQKLTLKEAKEEFESRGYTLLDDNYMYSRTKMRFRCPKHPDKETKISLNNLKRGHGCIYCGIDNKRNENHVCWKGGITTLNGYFRKTLKRWAKKSLEKHDYKCVITKEKNCDLQVHHPKPFHALRDETLTNTNLDIRKKVGDYTSEERKKLTKEFKRLHAQWEGIPMKRDIHELFHKEYGYETTIEDIYDFKARYEAGEFTEGNQEDKQLELIL